MKQTHAVFLGFAKADDSAAAHCDPRFTHGGQSLKAIRVRASSNNLSIKFRRSIQIVVVRGEPCRSQAFGLRFVKHSERATNLHAKFRDAANHLKNIFEVFAILYLSPRGAHAKPCCAFAASAPGKFRYFIYGQQAATSYLRCVMRALRAVGAIFRAAPSFDGEQPAKLHAPRVVEFPM